MVDQRKIVWVACCAFLFLVLSTVMESCNTKKEQTVNVSEKASDVAPPTFIGSAACQSCHTKEFDDWKGSDHFLAMQHANESTVLGDFENATFTADGVTNRFFK